MNEELLIWRSQESQFLSSESFSVEIRHWYADLPLTKEMEKPE